MIYVEDELIKLNGVVLPGLVKSIEVIETAKVDEQEVEGSATMGAGDGLRAIHQALPQNKPHPSAGER